MNDEELEREADARARRLIVGAWTTEARPGHREKVLAAMDAAAESRTEAGAMPVTQAPKTPRKLRRVLPPVALIVVAAAAIVLLVLHYRGRTQSIKPPGTAWEQGPTPAVPAPPRPRRHWP